MKFKITLSSIVISLAFIFSSCQESKFDATKLEGAWKVNSWTIESSGKAVNSKMDMIFANDGTYDINYGTESEKGKYWISGDNLHTVETGKSEKTVKILKLVTDTLQFQMNRAGQLENVLLLK